MILEKHCEISDRGQVVVSKRDDVQVGSDKHIASVVFRHFRDHLLFFTFTCRKQVNQTEISNVRFLGSSGKFRLFYRQSV